MIPIEYMLSQVDWKAVPRTEEPISEDLPYATHQGVLVIGGISLRCYRLNDGRAVFDADDFAAFFEGLGLE